jgi:hypothetical protein
MSTILTRAEEFIWRNARLLDRQLFAFYFQSGPAQAVADALRVYQNADGGFGNALEPDIRAPASQPVPVQHALEYMDAVGIWDAAQVTAVCRFLETISTAEGGIPFVLPSALPYPRAPWWQTDENPVASLNPTAAIAGLLHKHAVQHAWLEQATRYCWPLIEALDPHEEHVFAAVAIFLQHVPDRTRAAQQIERLGQALLHSGMVAEPAAEGYVRSALDWAPTPDHAFRHFFTPEQIAACVDVRIARQQEDGGWPITWPAPSAAAEQEWRGWITVQNLVLLRAHHRL